ncbi:WD40 repeat domain-containing protein [Pseudonocardia sp. C8]|uniref:WD40 repeat domain-containing protein n=1 Tax=Pseudonocardia sp. C8 TaxID=2762759 RepID=UPI001643111D|nr:WD40 repeat domain-containing protein [Pseudonocardia sp. C8]MBC3191842.1 WD40 repeat domain-containing protein [Pseudonocardia sp. C8]
MSAPATTPVWSLSLDEPVVEVAAGDDVAVAGGSEGTIAVVDASGDVRFRLELGDFLLSLALSEDGTRLAAGGGQRVRIWDVGTGRLLADHPARWCSALAWTASGDGIAIGDGRHVRVLDRDGNARWGSTAMRSTVAGLSWLRRDGRRIAAAAYRGVSILEPATDRVIEHLPAPGAIAGIAVSPHGRWVVGGSQDATLHGWKVPGGDDFQMSGFPTTVSRLAFDSTGRWMACDGGDTVAFWDFSGSGPTGREAMLGQGHRGSISALAWSTDTQRTLVTGDATGDVAVWHLGPDAGPGTRLRPSRTRTGDDPVGAVAARHGHVIVGHRSGALSRIAL